ncbi:MAG: sugar phosphate isomerase/epimerase [Rhizobiaceae bacterium]|nr:sugar phosphate isomerase/epimerase [Rhizobiaceae bacterium]
MDYSFQLYSARNFLPWDAVLERVAELGYKQLEGFGGVYENPEQFRAKMDKLGLTMPTGHFSLDALENNFDLVSDQVDKLGVQKIYCPYLAEDERPTDSAGWKNFAQRLAAVGAKAKAKGHGFGWHNHHFEFETLADGGIPQAILLDEAPDIEWEADIAWILRGGGDPLDWIERYGARITSVHVKDIAPSGQCEDEDGWADVGHGIVAWKNIMRALKQHSNTVYYVMEHDNPSNYERFAQRSIETMRKLEEV